MKENIKCILASLVMIILVISCNKSKEENSSPLLTRNSIIEDKYKSDIISISHNKQAGEKDPSGEYFLNDIIDISLYVKDYYSGVCYLLMNYYKNLYQPLADELNNQLTIRINIWDKKIESIDIYNMKYEKNNRGIIMYNFKSKYSMNECD
jgi:hypothetical protein